MLTAVSDTTRPRARDGAIAQIGGRLPLSRRTVQIHVARIFTKLELRDRAQAVVLAYETGLVRPGSG